MQNALNWLYENLYNYMIPVCGLCVLRIVMCLIELAHMKKLREKKFVYRRVVNHYSEIGAFIGLLIGCVLVCVIPSLALLFAAVAIALGVVGYRIGRQKGTEADAFWKDVMEEAAAGEEGHKVNALSVESNFGGLIDTLDVFDKPAEQGEETPAQAEEGAAQTECAGDDTPAAEAADGE